MSLRSIALVALPLTAAACGGKDDTNSGSRPAPAEVSKALQDAGGGALNAEVSNCIAEKLDSSEIPNGVRELQPRGVEDVLVVGEPELFAGIGWRRLSPAGPRRTEAVSRARVS